MIILNFSKRVISARTLAALARLGEMPIVVTSVIPPRNDIALPARVEAAVRSLGLDPRQNYSIVLPNDALTSALLIAAIRSAHGHFPWVLELAHEGTLAEIHSLSARYPSADDKQNG
jgi:hypothetical protein